MGDTKIKGSADDRTVFTAVIHTKVRYFECVFGCRYRLPLGWRASTTAPPTGTPVLSPMAHLARLQPLWAALNPPSPSCAPLAPHPPTLSDQLARYSLQGMHPDPNCRCAWFFLKCGVGWCACSSPSTSSETAQGARAVVRRKASPSKYVCNACFTRIDPFRSTTEFD